MKCYPTEVTYNNYDLTFDNLDWSMDGDESTFTTFTIQRTFGDVPSIENGCTWDYNNWTDKNSDFRLYGATLTYETDTTQAASGVYYGISFDNGSTFLYDSEYASGIYTVPDGTLISNIWVNIYQCNNDQVPSFRVYGIYVTASGASSWMSCLMSGH